MRNNLLCKCEKRPEMRLIGDLVGNPHLDKFEIWFCHTCGRLGWLRPDWGYKPYFVAPMLAQLYERAKEEPRLSYFPPSPAGRASGPPGVTDTHEEDT